MKKLMLILGLGLMIGMVNINSAGAQVHVNININVQPAWGPSGYDYVEFYYIPEVNVYYDVVHQLFYYHDRGRWISALFLPVMYSHYDFYSLYKVVLNGVHYPWKYNNRHRRAYKRYCYNYAQVPIFYMNESRYHHARNNYHGWVEPRYMPRNNGRPHSHDFSNNTRNGRISTDYRSSGNNSRPVNNGRREAADSRNKTSTRNNAVVNGRGSGNNNQRNLTGNSQNGRSSTNVRSGSPSTGNGATVNSRTSDNRNNATINNNSNGRNGTRDKSSVNTRSTNDSL